MDLFDNEDDDCEQEQKSQDHYPSVEIHLTEEQLYTEEFVTRLKDIVTENKEYNKFSFYISFRESSLTKEAIKYFNDNQFTQFIAYYNNQVFKVYRMVLEIHFSDATNKLSIKIPSIITVNQTIWIA
jgi:hypothetical protein